MSKHPVTLQQRLGFQDVDLSRPGHDQIMLWLSKVAPAKLPTWLGPPDPWPIEKVEGLRMNTQKNLSDRIAELKQSLDDARQCDQRVGTGLGRALSELSSDNTTRIERLSAALRELEALDITPPASMPASEIEGNPVWEHPVTNSGHGSKPFVIGFADMMVRYRRAQLALDLGDIDTQRFFDWQRYGRPLEKPSYFRWKQGCAYFEVKTEIPSLGELMRQIQLYRTYLRGDWFVVSPDTRFIETLAEQGVGFVEYKPGLNDLSS